MGKTTEFLSKFADLCKKYNATFRYTIDDDGIHIAVDDKEVFVGFLGDDPVGEIEKVIKAKKRFKKIIEEGDPFSFPYLNRSLTKKEQARLDKIEKKVLKKAVKEHMRKVYQDKKEM